jgi:hypothetical protein
MHGPIKVKSPNNNSKWQMGFNSAFKGLRRHIGTTSVKEICSFTNCVKVKFTLGKATKAQMGSACIALLFLNLGAGSG